MSNLKSSHSGIYFDILQPTFCVQGQDRLTTMAFNDLYLAVQGIIGVWKLVFIGLILVLFTTSANSQVKSNKPMEKSGKINSPIALWPDGAPGEEGKIGEERNESTPGKDLSGGKEVIRLGNVSNPTITVYPAKIKNELGPAMIVCPGGGYGILAYDLEGTEICEWLNSIGVTAVLLKYRVPRREGQPPYQAPLQDAQRALGLVRLHAAQWNINPQKIGIMGFSAGGHLSAALSTNFEKRTYEAIDAADQLSCRPDFTMLIYPGYLTLAENNHQLSPELMVNARTPPTLIVQTEDDPIPVEGSLFYYLALKKAKVPAEMHLYPNGGHGYGLRIKTGNISSWPIRAQEWLESMNIIKGNHNTAL